MILRRQAMLLLIIIAALPLVLASCIGKPGKKAAPKPPEVAITPAPDAKDVPTSTEIGATVTRGKISEITLTDAAGAKVDGAMRADGSTWIPGKELQHKQAYTAQVTATNDKGDTTTATSRFTTMEKPAKLVDSTLYFQNDQTYGVAMPVTVSFDPPVPPEARADVQRRLFVTTDPPQPGVWHWVEDGRQVYYRAPDFWQTGTKISVRSAFGGVPIGEETYGDADRTASATVGDKVTLEVDNATKQMSVFQDDQLTRTIPVSMGKPSTPTSSGKMVIMEKFESTVFDTTGSADPYVITVQDAQRVTWGGEFIHSAPWSVGSQGYTNVSHGCTNLSPADADWLMSVTHVGDLVTFKGTEVKLDPGNGWTAWDMSWEEYVQGSALPVPANLKPAPPANAAPAPGGPAPAGSPAPAPSTSGR